MKSIILSLETVRSRTAQVNFEKEFADKEIKIGDGATICYYSDREPCTIIDIADNGSWIKVQVDHAKRIDNYGMSECQEYEYSRDENGRVYVFKRTRKDKSMYTDNGVSKWGNYGMRLSFGGRRKYFDYSF